MRTSLLSLLLFISLVSLSLSTSLNKEINGFKEEEEEDKCGYIIEVKTGNVDNAGTDAIVSLELAGPDRRHPEFSIRNLKHWGVMGLGHHYFQKGNLDIFEVPAPCIPEVPCWMLLFHDNMWNNTELGKNPGWRVDHVTVITIVPPSQVKIAMIFHVNQWLALDKAPHQLHAERNYCGKYGKGHTIKLNSEV